MQIVPFYDRTRLVDTTLETVSHNMIEGVVLVSLVLWLFLRAVSRARSRSRSRCRWRCWRRSSACTTRACPRTCCRWGRSTSASCWTAPSSWSRTPTGTWPRSARARGRRRHRGARAAKEVVRPTLFSMSIIAAAMMPIFTLERVEGRIFRPVALTYAFALLGALFFTMTAVPALTAVSAEAPQGVSEHEPGFLRLAARALPDRCCGWRCATRSAPPIAGVGVLALAVVAGAPPGRRVPARDERRGHPRHGHDAQRRLAGSRRRGAARDAARAAVLPGGEGRPHRAGPPGGRHRRRGAEPGRDVRDHEARGRVEDRPQQGADRGRDARRASSGAPASSTTSASRSRIASRNRSPASAARSS